LFSSLSHVVEFDTDQAAHFRPALRDACHHPEMSAPSRGGGAAQTEKATFAGGIFGFFSSIFWNIKTSE
jgi:hypothetical protein